MARKQSLALLIDRLPLVGGLKPRPTEVAKEDFNERLPPERFHDCPSHVRCLDACSRAGLERMSCGDCNVYAHYNEQVTRQSQRAEIVRQATRRSGSELGGATRTTTPDSNRSRATPGVGNRTSKGVKRVRRLEKDDLLDGDEGIRNGADV